VIAGLHAPAPADWERISSRLDVLSAAVMSLLRRVKPVEKRLEAPSGIPGSSVAERRATPDLAAAEPAAATHPPRNAVPPCLRPDRWPSLTTQPPSRRSRLAMTLQHAWHRGRQDSRRTVSPGRTDRAVVWRAQ
jgi:hypothetical protein